MCLAVPSKITEIDASGLGRVDHLGVSIRVNFSLLPDVRPGDWVIVHAGFAISKLDDEEARATLEMLRDMMKAA